MKKLLLAACLLLTFGLSAQDMGTKYIGGTIGFGSTKAKADGAEASTNWSVSPEFGYFVAENLAVGIRLGIDGASQGDNSSSGFGADVYARKFFSASDAFRLFVGANVGYATSKNTTTVGGVEFDSKENHLSAFLDLGATYDLSEKWTLIGRLGTLGFSSVSDPDNDKAGSTNFGLNVNTFGNPFQVGLYYKF